MKREEILYLLPNIFQRTIASRPTVLQAMLGVMERLHDPDETILEHIDAYFDPGRSDDTFIPYLASWVDLDRFLDESGGYPAGIEQLRVFILAAARLARQRGTRAGLIEFLEAATGATGFEIKDDPDTPFHVTVILPACPKNFKSTQGGQDYRALVKAIVDAEKPAFLTYQLVER